MVQKYQLKALTLQAIQWTGANLQELKTWGAPVNILPDSNDQVLILGKIDIQAEQQIIKTVPKNAWIVQGVNNEWYMIKSNVFDQLYNKL